MILQMCQTIRSYGDTRLGELQAQFVTSMDLRDARCNSPQHIIFPSSVVRNVPTGLEWTEG